MYFYEVLKDFKKLDIILAFLISLILFYIFTKKIYLGLMYSSCFVILFLLILNLKN